MILRIFPSWWPYLATTISPFILTKKRKLPPAVLNHEYIHVRQQGELFGVFFYVLYGLEFVVRLFQYGKWGDAYRNISFEREAFAKERDFKYLATRPAHSWVKYLRSATPFEHSTKE